MAMKTMQGIAPRYQHFAARVVLPFDHPPQFLSRCPGCDDPSPALSWSPTPGMSPFTGKAQYFGNHNMLPHIEIPVCAVCINHMPGRTRELSSLVASHLVPLFLACATVFFYTMQLYAVAALTGAACLVWFILAMKAVWIVDQSTLFDLQVGRDDSLIYYFRDREYASEFNRMNEANLTGKSRDV